MAYQIRDGDILSLADEKAGALTMSVPLHDFQYHSDPGPLWESQSALRIVVGYIARKVAVIPLHLYRRVSDTDRERITGTPVAEMLKRPVPGRSWARLAEQLITDMAVYDRWACFVDVDDDGRTPILRRLPAHRIAVRTVNAEPRGVLLFGGDNGDSPVVELPLDRVVFDVAPSAHPVKNDRGAPRIPTLSGVLGELADASDLRRAVAQNGPNIPAVIERPHDAPAWSDAAFNRFQQTFGDYRRGGGRDGQVPILEDGMSLRSVDRVSASEAASTTGLRSVTIEEAAMLFHVPPELVGVRPGNYSNLAALRELEYVDVLGPWAANMESALNIGLAAGGWLPLDEYIEANVDSRLRGAFEQEAAVLSTSVGAPWMTRNEARARKNLPAVDGGDEMVTPLNVLVGGQTSPQDGETGGRGGGTLPGEDDEDPDAGSKATLSPPVPQDLRPGWPLIHAEQDRFARQFATYGRALHARIAERAAAIEGAAKAATNAPLSALLDRTTLTRLVGRYGLAIAEAGAAEVNAYYDPLGALYDPTRLQPWVVRVADGNANLMEAALSERIADAVAAETFEEFATDPSGLLALTERYARTWGTEYAEFGRNDAARASGVRRKVWRTASREPRSTHARLNGVSVGIEETFSNGCAYPGDWQGGADEVANCACWVEYTNGV